MNEYNYKNHYVDSVLTAHLKKPRVEVPSAYLHDQNSQDWHKMHEDWVGHAFYTLPSL